MSDNSEPLPESQWPKPKPVVFSRDALTAMDTIGYAESLNCSIIALRYALEVLQKAPGHLGLHDDDGHRTEASDLRDRVIAATRLVTAAVDVVAHDGHGVISGVKTMLGVE